MFGSRTARLCQTPLGNTDLSHFPSCVQNVTAVAFICSPSKQSATFTEDTNPGECLLGKHQQGGGLLVGRGVH